MRFVVLYKNMPDRPTAYYWRLFGASPDLYPPAFENKDVLIVSTEQGSEAPGRVSDPVQTPPSAPRSLEAQEKSLPV